MLCPNTQAVTNGYFTTIFPKTCRNLDLGMGIMYMKLGGPIPFFPRYPQYRYVGGKMEKKACKKKGNNVGSSPFLPMTRQNLDVGMGKL